MPEPEPPLSDSFAPVERASHRRLQAVLEVILCSSVPTQIVIQNLAVLAGLQPWRTGNIPSLPFVVVTQLTDTVVLIALMVALTRARGERVSELWLGPRPISGEAILGLKLVPVVLLAVIVFLTVIGAVAPGLHNVKENPLEQLPSTALQAVVFGVVVILAGGVREELQRAFLLRRVEQELGGATVGVVLLSIAFGAGHVLQGWDAAIVTGALGAFWAIVYLRRRSVVAPLVSHAGFNALEVLRAALVP